MQCKPAELNELCAGMKRFARRGAPENQRILQGGGEPGLPGATEVQVNAVVADSPDRGNAEWRGAMRNCGGERTGARLPLPYLWLT